MNARDYRRRLDRLAAEHGFRVEMTRGDHYALKREGTPTVFAAQTPSDRKVLWLIRRKIRRALREAA